MDTTNLLQNQSADFRIFNKTRMSVSLILFFLSFQHGIVITQCFTTVELRRKMLRPSSGQINWIQIEAEILQS
jgi:hypothetical protein